MTAGHPYHGAQGQHYHGWKLRRDLGLEELPDPAP
jgi:hypothetical protein